MFEKLKTIPTHMDYEGQKKAEKIFQAVILVTAVMGFFAGYITQQFSHTVYFLAAGFALCCIVRNTRNNNLLEIVAKLLNQRNAPGFLFMLKMHSLQEIVAKMGLNLTLPPWPIYRTTPLPWQKPLPEEPAEGTPTGSSKKQKKK